MQNGLISHDVLIFNMSMHKTFYASNKAISDNEFLPKFSHPVATRMVKMQNPIMEFLKTMKGNYTGEDLLLYTAQLKTCCINRHVVPFCEIQAALEDMLSFQHKTHA